MKSVKKWRRFSLFHFLRPSLPPGLSYFLPFFFVPNFPHRLSSNLFQSLILSFIFFIFHSSSPPLFDFIFFWFYFSLYYLYFCFLLYFVSFLLVYFVPNLQQYSFLGNSTEQNTNKTSRTGYNKYIF